jgi:hypothetical protein
MSEGAAVQIQQQVVSRLQVFHAVTFDPPDAYVAPVRLSCCDHHHAALQDLARQKARNQYSILAM